MSAQVAPGVHRLGDRGVNWWLVVDGGAATVVDAGLPAQHGQLVSLLGRLGLGVGAIEAVVVTHGHVDHFACVPRIRAQADVAVHLPRADVAAAARRPRLDPAVLLHGFHPAALLTVASYVRQGVLGARPLVDVIAIDDGMVLDIPGRPRFVHAPGHTPGSGMFLLEDRGVLFSGDVLVTLDPFRGRTGPRTLPAFDNEDHALAVRSLDLVARSGADVVLPGHGEPWRGGAAEAAAAARAASG